MSCITIKTAIKNDLIKVGDIVKKERYKRLFVVKSIITNEKSDYSNGLLCDYLDIKTREKLREWGQIGMMITCKEKYMPHNEYKQLTLF